MHLLKQLCAGFIFCVLVAPLLVGCASSVGSKIVVSSANVSKYDALSSNDAVAALGKRIDDARTANMPFLAPSYFKEAEEIHTEAQKSLSKQPKEELVGNLAKADALLDKGVSVMQIVQSRLASELQEKVYLEKFNSAKPFPGDYKDTIDDLSDLINMIERGKADDIEKDRTKLLKSMQALVIRTVQYNTLHDAELINEDTNKKNGEKLAPATFAIALSAYQDAIARIAQNPHDETAVAQAGKDALFAANHAKHVTERVIFLQGKLKESIENIVIDEEKRLLDISTALDHGDVRDQPVGKQAEELAQTAKLLAMEKQKANLAIVSSNEQFKALELRLKESKELLESRGIQIETLHRQIAALEETAKNTGAALQESSQNSGDSPVLAEQPQ